MSFLSLLGVSELNVDVLNIDTINLSSVQPYSVLTTDVNRNVVGTTLTDGQILIGQTDDEPVAASLNGSTDIIITTSPGSISLDTVQAIDSSASPEFATVKLNNLTATSLVGSNGSKQLQSITLASNNGMVNTVAGSTLTISTPQDLRTSAKVTFNQMNVINNNNAIFNTVVYTPTGTGNTALGGYGSMGIARNISSSNCTSAGTFSLQGLISGSLNTAYGYNTLKAVTNQVSNTAIGSEAGVSNTGSYNCFIGSNTDATVPVNNVVCLGYQATATASNTIALGNGSVTSIIPGASAVCDLGSSSRMFKNLYIDDVIVDNLTSSKLVATDTNKKLQSITISNSNANGTNNNLSFSGSTITMNSSMNQNLDVGANPSFGRPYLTGATNGGILVVPPHPSGGQIYNEVAQNGKFLIGSFDASNSFTFWQQGTITGGSSITVNMNADFTGTNPYFNINTIQPITTASTPTFANLVLSGTTPRITYDVGDYLEYDRTSNLYQFNIGNTPCFQISASSVSSALPFVASNGSIQLASTTITAPGFGAPRTHAIPYANNSNFILSDATNTFNSSNTFNGVTNFNNTIGTVADIHFQAGVTDADFVIKSDTFNGLQFYDIARGMQMHIFQGRVKIDTDLYLPTSGGTASPLNYYEEYTYTTTLQGPWASGSNPAISFLITRIGRLVSLTSTADVSVLCSIASTITIVNAIPTRFRPAASTTQVAVTINSAPNPTISRVRIGTAGDIQWWSGNVNNFAIGTFAGVYVGTITWTV